MHNGPTVEAPEWQTKSPYRLENPQEGFEKKYTAACHCGAVEFAASSDPLDVKYCHCKVCQHVHGAPFQWAAIFHKQSILFTKGVEQLEFYNTANGRTDHQLPTKVLCSICHSPLADEGRKMFLAFPTAFRFEHGEVPAAFKPSCHIFYGSRVVDVQDGAPKFAGMKGDSKELPETR